MAMALRMQMTSTNANVAEVVVMMPRGLECNQPTSPIPARKRISPPKGRTPMPPTKCSIHASLGRG